MFGEFSLEKLSVDDFQRLVRDVTFIEIIEALRLSPSNKAPGPAGVSMGFYKKMWDVIKLDVLKVIQFQNFFGNCSLSLVLNSSFIALDPKGDRPVNVTDCHLISLINSCMKLITNIVALRLSRNLDKLISTSQSGFMKGR